MVGQGGKQVEDVGRVVRPQDRGRRRCRERRGEGTKAGESLLLGRLELGEAPVEGGPQRPLPRGHITGARRQVEHVPKPPASSSTDMTAARAATSSMASGRPSRRRQIRATATAFDSSTTTVPNGGCPPGEQLDGLGLEDLGRAASRSGTASGAYRHFLLAAQSQRYPAGYQQPQPRCGRQQLVDLGRCSMTDSKSSRISSAALSSCSAVTATSGSADPPAAAAPPRSSAPDPRPIRRAGRSQLRPRTAGRPAVLLPARAASCPPHPARSA